MHWKSIIYTPARSEISHTHIPATYLPCPHEFVPCPPSSSCHVLDLVVDVLVLYYVFDIMEISYQVKIKIIHTIDFFVCFHLQMCWQFCWLAKSVGLLLYKFRHLHYFTYCNRNEMRLMDSMLLCTQLSMNKKREEVVIMLCT